MSPATRIDPASVSSPNPTRAAKTYVAAIAINATAEEVWAVLTDGSRYLEWNTTVLRFDGDIVEGETVTLVAKVSPERPFAVKVKKLDAPHLMVWSGGMPLRLFTGERRFTVVARPQGGVTLTIEEHFRGLLAPLFLRSMPDLQSAFDDFASDVKRRVEG